MVDEHGTYATSALLVPTILLFFAHVVKTKLVEERAGTQNGSGRNKRKGTAG